MLVLDSVSKGFGQTRAVNGVCLSIPKGAFVGVIGRSGAGKSTLLRLVNRLTDPGSGRILWDGRDITGLRGGELREWRRSCAMIFQQFNLIGRLDVLDNVLMGRLTFTPGWRAATKLWRREDRAIAMAALDEMDIAQLASQRAETLSGGQQQRVAICRALVQEPEIVLADEPVASLDPRSAKIVMDALLRINRHFDLTVLCNLHSLDLARTYCDRLVGMAAGRVVFEGAPAALTDDVARQLYGLEANEVMDRPDATPAPDLADVGVPAAA